MLDCVDGGASVIIILRIRKNKVFRKKFAFMHGRLEGDSWKSEEFQYAIRISILELSVYLKDQLDRMDWTLCIPEKFLWAQLGMFAPLYDQLIKKKSSI